MKKYLTEKTVALDLTRLDFEGVGITRFNRLAYENERSRAGLLDE